MKGILWISIFALLGMSTAWCQEARLRLRVVDDLGAPVPDARVVFAFEQLRATVPPEVKHTTTDETGLTTATGATSGRVSMSIKKDGYHPTWPPPFISHTVENGRYIPYDSLGEVVLKRRIKPIPMYAKRALLIIPVLNDAVGLDLKKGDWVTPHGRGIENDLQFTVHKRVVDFRDFDATLELQFSNPQDGICEFKAHPRWGSELRSSHSAPDTGYDRVLKLNYSSEIASGADDDVSEANFVFRVRSKTRDSGAISAANYGKIYGRIELYPVESKTAKIRFTYYLNPVENDRNIEFDPSQNLFGPSKGGDRVVLP